MRRPTCALALAAAFVGAAPAAAAGPAWLEPISLSGPGAAPPAVGLGPAGDAATTWTNSAEGGRAEARLRAPDAPYGEVQVLGAGGSTPPDVAVAADGTAVAAWGEGGRVLFSVRPPGGGFGTPQLLAADSSGSGNVTAVRVAMTPAGDAVIAYLRGGAFATTRPSGGSPGTPQGLGSGAACDLDAAIGSAGHAAVSWRDCGSAGSQIHVGRSGSGGFSVTAVASGTAPVVAVDGAGTTVLAWESGGVVRAATARPGAGFGGSSALSDEGTLAGDPALAAVPDGVWAAWRVTPASRIHAARRPVEGAFGPGAAVSADGVEGGRPALAGAGDGSAVVAWVRQADDSYRIEFARRAPGADGFGAPSLVSASASQTGGLELDGDGDGNYLAGYVRGGVATAQTLDAAGPRLLDISVREAGHALDEYPFSVRPVDAWSGVASSAFDFGDGTSAAGPHASHAYSGPGQRTVTISAADGLGNISTATRGFLAAPPLDRTAPVITNARMDATRFRRSRKETAVVARRRARRATRFRYTLSEPSQVNIFFERVLLGRKRGRACHRTGSRRARRCRLYEPAGLITRTHPVAGAVSTAFTGRIVGRSGPLKVLDVSLRPGRYRATIVASDANRNVSKPVQLAFTILR